MRFGIRRAEISDADDDIAIRIRAGRRRGQDVDRTNLQDALRARGAGSRLDGKLRAQGIQAANGSCEAGTAAGYALRSGIDPHTSIVPAEPGLRRTGKSRTRAQARSAPAQARSGCEQCSRVRCARSGRAIRARNATRGAGALRRVALAAGPEHADASSLKLRPQAKKRCREGVA